ncbi:DUF6009 family protein [Natrinema pallidum]|uniref:Uncharacterized protein n=1 Tax=Natrinema pallidum DSM 3751 TaxID=1227495 RepID=L9YGL2_9EURY|nr:DUF6009 family protein [Natrinema pallidum]ELY73234.1 hypothetical protein C487_17570 [Natrinema pallidum DSM 3751]
MTTKSLEHETKIVWEIDPTEVEYVREHWFQTGTRTRPIPMQRDDYTRCGYAVLEADAPKAHSPHVFNRRGFYLKDSDRHLSDDVDVFQYQSPAEGVDPLTVRPGQRGEKTSRTDDDRENAPPRDTLEAENIVLNLDGNDPVPESGREHEIPFVTTQHERFDAYEQFNDQMKPALLVRQIRLRTWSYIEIQMPYGESAASEHDHLRLTEAAIEEANRVIDSYEDKSRDSGFGYMGAPSVSDSDYISLPHMRPKAAMDLASELYPIVMDDSNLEFHKENL